MEDLKRKMQDNGQAHIFEAFPNLKTTDPLARQLAKIDVRNLLDSYGEAKSLDKQFDGTGCLQCNGCCEEITPADCVRLYDNPMKR